MSKLYVGNINWNTSEAALASCFGQYGSVVEAKIMMDRETGRSRGFGFVTMSTAEEAHVAQEKLDGVALDGRPLRVNEAREQEPRGGRGFSGGGGGGGDPRREWKEDKRERRNGRRDRDY